MGKSLAQEVIEYSLVSSTVGKLRIQKKDGSFYETRGQMHVLITAPFGAGKSAFLRTIAEAGLGEILTDYSMPGIIGTIKRSGEIVEGNIIRTAGRTTIIDEFQKFGKKEREALLSLMEDQYFSRTMGYKIQVPITRKGEFYELHAEGNWFEIRVKTNFVIGAMYFRKNSMEDKALLSRAFPLMLEVTAKEAFRSFLEGNPLKYDKNIAKIREKIKNMDMTIPHEVAEYLVKNYEQYATKYQLETGFIMRGLTEISRMAGLHALLDDREEATKEDVDAVLKFVPIQMLGYNLNALTPSTIEVYTVILNSPEGINQKAIIQATRLPRMTVFRAIQELLAKELVEQVKVGRKVYYFPRKWGEDE